MPLLRCILPGERFTVLVPPWIAVFLGLGSSKTYKSASIGAHLRVCSTIPRVHPCCRWGQVVCVVGLAAGEKERSSMAANYWNYVDALAYALALNTPDDSETLTADPAKWHQGIYNLLETFRDRLPGVLDQVVFDERPGYPPYSSQVEHFLHVQAQARLISGANPAYAVLEMSAKQKSAIIRMNEDRLGDKKDELKVMGEQLLAFVHHGG